MEAKLKIEYLPAEKLVHLEGNPRRIIDPDAVKKLQKLISEHGFQNPLQVFKEKNGQFSILCGNHRFDAGVKLGIEEFPCIVYDGSRAKALARAISDNKSNDWTEWDFPKLKDFITELDSGEFDIELTGFDQAELDNLFNFQSPENQWEGMPEYINNDLSSKISMIVNFQDEKSKIEFGNIIGQSLTIKTRSIWHPHVPSESVKHLGYSEKNES